MIKVVTLLTRKPGMSREAFIEHYETHHRKIGEKYLSGFAVKYQRRYLQSAGFRGQEGATLPFDVLMEIWYPDQDTLDAASPCCPQTRRRPKSWRTRSAFLTVI